MDKESGSTMEQKLKVTLRNKHIPTGQERVELL